jgi:hypothetical protein
VGSGFDFSRIEEVCNRKVQSLKDAIHGLKAQATLPMQEIRDVRLPETRFFGERRARKLVLSDSIGYYSPK